LGPSDGNLETGGAITRGVGLVDLEAVINRPDEGGETWRT